MHRFLAIRRQRSQTSERLPIHPGNSAARDPRDPCLLQQVVLATSLSCVGVQIEMVFFGLVYRLAKALATHSCKVTSVVLGEEKREGRFSSTHFTGVHWLSPVLSSLADELRATQLQRQAVDPIHSLTASNEKFDEGQGVGGSGRGEKEDFCCVGSGLASCELVPMHTADAIFLLSGFTVGAVMRLEAPVSERELIEIAGACADSAEVMHASPVRFGGLCYWAPHFCRDLRLHVSTRKVDGGEGGEVEHGEAMDRSGKVDQRLGAESESRPKDEIKERVGGTGEDGERERGGEGRGRAGESLEGMDRLDAAIEREVQRPLASDQPMWRLTQLTYDPPLPSARGGGLGRAALVLTFHHCMGDGAWLNALLHQATSRRLRSQSVSAPMQGEGAGGASGAVGREAQSAPRRAGSVCGAVLYNSWAWTLQLGAPPPLPHHSATTIPHPRLNVIHAFPAPPSLLFSLITLTHASPLAQTHTFEFAISTPHPPLVHRRE